MVESRAAQANEAAWQRVAELVIKFDNALGSLDLQVIVGALVVVAIPPVVVFSADSLPNIDPIPLIREPFQRR